ncbi:hypothetical protein NEAUS04_1652 [Nematocida ausubeli]|nr:hypothetical protein NEAUS04_1652 [Nematocida ausubeli]
MTLHESVIDRMTAYFLTVFVSISMHAVCIVLKNNITKFIFPRTTNSAACPGRYRKIKHSVG